MHAEPAPYVPRIVPGVASKNGKNAFLFGASTSTANLTVPTAQTASSSSSGSEDSDMEDVPRTTASTSETKETEANRGDGELSDSGGVEGATEEEEEAHVALPESLVAYCTKARKAVAHHLSKHKLPSEYQRGTIWIRRPEAVFLLSNPKTLPDPNELLLPDLMLVLPEFFSNKRLRCRNPDVKPNGQFECQMGNMGSKDTLTHRSAIDTFSLDIYNFGFAKGLGPEAVANMTRELAAKAYDRKRQAYLSAIIHRFKIQQLHGKKPADLPQFPPFDSSFAKISTPPLPSATWIRRVLLDDIQKTRAALDQAISLLDATVLQGDGSFKIIKHAIHGFLSVCYTMLNGYGEMRLQILGLSKELEHLRPALALLQESLRAHGFPEVKLLFIDNIAAEAPFFESAIPSLRHEVEHVAPPNVSGLPLATLPPFYRRTYTSSYNGIDAACWKLLSELQGSSELELAVGFDTEHPTAMSGEEGGGRGKTAVVTLSTLTEGFVLQVAALEELPPNLIKLMKDPKILKLGRNVAIDFTWLCQDFPTSLPPKSPSGRLELLDFLRDRDICPFDKGNATLQELAAFAVGKHLPKPEDVRCSSWAADLSPEQLDYAYLDAFIAVEIYSNVRCKKAYNISVGTRSFPANTEVLLREKPRSRRPKLIGILLDEDGTLIRTSGTIFHEPPNAPAQSTLSSPHESPAASPHQSPSASPRLSPSPRSSSSPGPHQPSPPQPATLISNLLNPITRSVILGPTIRRVLVQRIDAPAYKVPGYSISLQHATTPFEMAIPSSLLYTRPPLADRSQLPPLETEFDSELRRAAARTNDGDSNDILTSMEAEADAIAGDGLQGEDGIEREIEAGPSREPIQGPPPQSSASDEDDEDEPNKRVTRIFSDIFHVIMKIDVARAHELAREFSRRFSSVILVPDEEDKAAVIGALAKLPVPMTWDEALLARPKWIWQRVRRVVPPSAELIPALEVLFDTYRDVVDSKTGKTLFNKAARENEASVLALARGGYLSDPQDFSMYTFVRTDEHGLSVWRCLRGTNPTEGLHAKLIRWLSAFNADPELLDGYLAVFRQRHNSDVGYFNRYGEPWRLHYNPALMNEVDNLHYQVFGESGYNNYRNGSHYQQTTEKFGIVPIAPAIADAVGIERGVDPLPGPPAQFSFSPKRKRMRKVKTTRISNPSHRFITTALGTRTNIGPIRTSAERRSFYSELKKLRGAPPSDVPSQKDDPIKYLTWLYAKPPQWSRFCKALNRNANVLMGERGIAYHLPNQVSTFFFFIEASQTNSFVKVASFYAISKKASQTKASLCALAPDLEGLNTVLSERGPHPQPEGDMENTSTLRPQVPNQVRVAPGPRLPLMPNRTLARKLPAAAARAVPSAALPARKTPRKCACCMEYFKGEDKKWGQGKTMPEAVFIALSCDGRGGRKNCPRYLHVTWRY
ncbi:hypothetical protein P7C70_g3399, partial [Phenoliferia sp. Uapishka_3]